MYSKWNSQHLYVNLYVDQYGNPVNRNRHEWPYSYDAYVTYQKSGYTYESGTQQGLHIEYHDRMMQWNWEKFHQSMMTVCGKRQQTFKNLSTNQIKEFLELYNDVKEVDLLIVMEGCNVSNGYPYWIFFYTIVE